MFFWFTCNATRDLSYLLLLQTIKYLILTLTMEPGKRRGLNLNRHLGLSEHLTQDWGAPAWRWLLLCSSHPAG